MHVLRHYAAAKRTYNLTVAIVHTYYVLAGDTPVLVHNTGGCGPIETDRSEGSAATPSATETTPATGSGRRSSADAV
ncbi:hypothetical protein [Amycolatopsis tolypomycina]|uniref:hypothetical protein n=1 Tax=Amycolatopsis tolypomycina TaxID=208445 RepID=UPI0033A3DAB2